MDEFLNQLKILEEQNIFATAYADDLALVISGNSRVRIEESVAVAIDIICKWCISYKLQIDSDKTKAILVKGNFYHGRMPKLIIQGKRIEFVNEYKYLGVVIDRKLGFTCNT